MSKSRAQNMLSKEISIIIPAYNEGDVIQGVVEKIVSVMEAIGEEYEILIVDDGSSDDTVEKARLFTVQLIQHPYNIGYGAALKTGIRHARGNVLVMIDSDGQHDPNDIPRLLEKVGSYDMVVGNRTRQSDTALHRNIANSLYNVLASYVSGRKIEDLTSGFRAIKARIARQFLYLLPNTFSSSSTLTLSLVRAGYSLCYIPVVVARRPGKNKSKIKPLQDGLRFLLLILKVAIFYAPLKIFVPLSILLFTMGFGYGLIRVVVWRLNYGSTSTLFMSTSILVFLVGLVSEQIAQLRFDRSEANTFVIDGDED